MAQMALKNSPAGALGLGSSSCLVGCRIATEPIEKILFLSVQTGCRLLRILLEEFLKDHGTRGLHKLRQEFRVAYTAHKRAGATLGLPFSAVALRSICSLFLGWETESTGKSMKF